MSRDFLLILGGGLVSLITTLVVLYVSDYIYRRDELLYLRSLPAPTNAPAMDDEAIESEALVLEEDAAEDETQPSEEEQTAVLNATEVQSET